MNHKSTSPETTRDQEARFYNRSVELYNAMVELVRRVPYEAPVVEQIVADEIQRSVGGDSPVPPEVAFRAIAGTEHDQFVEEARAKRDAAFEGQ